MSNIQNAGIKRKKLIKFMKKLFLVMTLPMFLFLQNALGEVTFPEGTTIAFRS